jgi:5,5'-dehydrodivanillate O-demethylase oxygenase subunit
MLSSEDNTLLTRVGPGTEMGTLLRRYWWPIGAAKELDDAPTKSVRLLGEDLVLFRDLSGSYGLLDRHCPHRRASLEFGMPEAKGLRCSYHGWLFDRKGACLEQPFEKVADPEGRGAASIRTKAYPVEEKAGVLFAYLGPDPVPCLWDWDHFYAPGYKEIILAELPCNWLQVQENSIDPVHFEWLHLNWSRRQQGNGDHAPKHLKIGFEEFEHGFVYRRVVEGQSEMDEPWSVGRVCLWPNCLFVGTFDWCVPIDEYHTLRVIWAIHRLPGERDVYQKKIPYWYAPIFAEGTNRWRTARFVNQDFAIVSSQGPVVDRTREHLGRSDRGVTMLRKRFLADLDSLRRGNDPKNVIRDPERNRRLKLPLADDQMRVPDTLPPSLIEGRPLEIQEELEALCREQESEPAGCSAAT